MSKYLYLSLMFLTLSLLCFASASYRMHRAFMAEEDIKRSFTAASVYDAAQRRITDKYAATGEIMDSFAPKDMGMYLLNNVDEYKMVTVKGAPLIDYVEYNGHKYPEVDKDSEIFSLSENVKDFNAYADERARDSLLPMLYAGACRYITQYPDEVRENGGISAEALLEKGDFFIKEPKKTAYLMQKSDTVKIYLNKARTRVNYVSFDGEDYSPCGDFWQKNADHSENEAIAERICAAAEKYMEARKAAGEDPEHPLKCETLVKEGYLDESPLPENMVSIITNRYEYSVGGAVVNGSRYRYKPE